MVHKDGSRCSWRLQVVLAERRVPPLDNRRKVCGVDLPICLVHCLACSLRMLCLICKQYCEARDKILKPKTFLLFSTLYRWEGKVTTEKPRHLKVSSLFTLLFDTSQVLLSKTFFYRIRSQYFLAMGEV